MLELPFGYSRLLTPNVLGLVWLYLGVLFSVALTGVGLVFWECIRISARVPARSDAP